MGGRRGAERRLRARFSRGPRGSPPSRRSVAALGTTRCGAGQPAPKSSVRIVSLAASRRCAVLGVGAALLGEQEAGAGDGGARARVERSLDVGALGDAAGERAAGSRRAARLAPARAAPAPASCRARGRPPRRPGRSPRRRPRRGPRAPPATEPHWWIQTPGVRRLGLPQKVTTDIGRGRRLEPVAPGEGQQQVDRERAGRSALRAARSSRSIAAAPLTAIVPRPPASETAAASSWRLSPPPIPAWTTGRRDAEALEDSHLAIL